MSAFALAALGYKALAAGAAVVTFIAISALVVALAIMLKRG